MRRSLVSRFLGVLLTAVFALQFPLTASIPLCVMAGTRMAGAPLGSGDMAARMPTVIAPVVGGTSSARMDVGTMPERAPCNQQMRWPVCQSMGSCIAALAPADGSAPGMPRQPAGRAAPLVVITPPALTYPPDLPPPRA